MKRLINGKYLLGIILIVGFVLRLISLNQSLWLDEATTALVSKMSLENIFNFFLPGDFHPPFYYLLMKYWVLVFGSSEISLRLPSIIFGVGTIYITFLIAKKLFSSRIGLIAGALSATSGLMIYYSQEARMYCLAMFLVTSVVYMYLQKKWIWFSLLLVCLGMTDYVALLIVPVFLIFDKKSRKKIFVGLLPLVIAFLFWLPVFWRQLTGGLSTEGGAWWNILGTLSFKNIGLIPVKFILGRIGFDNKIIYALIAIIVCGLFSYMLLKSIKSSKLIWAWLLAPILLGIFLSLKLPILHYFRFLFCLPAFYILVAYGVERIGKYKYVLITLLLAINIASSFCYLLSSRFQREDWRAAADSVGLDTVIFPGNVHTEALYYYGKGNRIIKISDLDTTRSSIWLSRYVWEITDPEDLTRHKIESLEYSRVGEYNFNGVVFWRYTKSLYAGII